MELEITNMDRNTEDMVSLTTEEYIEKYGQMVYRLAYVRTKKREDADDVYQDVFLAFIRHMKNLKSEDHIRYWLIHTTCNACKRLSRRRMWFRLEDTDITYELVEPDNTLSLVLALPDKMREAIHLFYYEDMTCEEIARALKISCEAVRVRLHRGREMLKIKLEKENEQ